MKTISNFLQSLLYIICGTLLMYIVLGFGAFVAAIMVPYMCVQDAVKLFNNKQKRGIKNGQSAQIN